ncbi:MAG: amidohydrolase family protein [Clostridiales bacterium]|nr:amidohydrolase family protein [Clostridiales bacterium]
MSELIEKVRAGLPFHDEVLIDVHTHCGPLRQSYIPENNIDSIVANMDRIGIKQAWQCTAECGTFSDPFIQNDYLAECVNRHPGKLMGYATISGNYKSYPLPELLRCEKMGLTLGIKMHVYRQNYSVADRFLYPMYEHLNSRHALFLHHDFGPVSDLEQIIRDFPDITFIHGHCGLKYKELYKKYDNLYNCTCAGMGYNSVTEAINVIGADRVLYGSDFTVLDITFGFGPVVYAKVSDDDKRKVLGLNAIRLLKTVKMP